MTTITDEALQASAWMSRPDLILVVEGGLVQSAEMSDGSPVPFAIEVHDLDTDTADPDAVETDEEGNEALVYQVW